MTADWNQIDLAIREALFERLVAEGFECKLGSTCRDCSYLDYSDAIEVLIPNKYRLEYNLEHSLAEPATDQLMILVGEKRPGAPPHSIRVMWTSNDFGYKDLFGGTVNPDIAEPDFESTFTKIISVLRNFQDQREVLG